MRAVVYVGPGKVEVRDTAPPGSPARDDAVVDVTLSGICGTDLHLIRGDTPGVEVGTVLGHEFVGRVAAIGEGVRRVAVGDVVMASDFTACGRCRHCDRSAHWHCANRAFFGTGTAFGPSLVGAQAEQVMVPHADTTLTRLPEGCAPDTGILMSDNLSTAWTALSRGRVQAGESVVVIGGGAVGQLTAQCALAIGASRVIVVEPSEGRRRFAEDHGAIGIAPEEARGLVAMLTGGDGADLVVDAVGGNRILDVASSLVRPMGRLVSVGVPHEATWPMPVLDAFTSEMSLSFVIGNPFTARGALSAMVAGGAIDPTSVIDAHLPIDAAPDTYDRLIRQEILKAVITF